jgi:hypothetical protein
MMVRCRPCDGRGFVELIHRGYLTCDWCMGLGFVDDGSGIPPEHNPCIVLGVD